MIANTYSVLALFVGAVELLAGVVAAAIAIRTLRALRTGGPGAEAAGARALPLLGLMSTLLVGLAAASAPLLYLVLRSYVGQWEGVMCVDGVTRIGTGSLGAAGWLPSLLTVLAVTKPLLLLTAGGCFVLHLVNRRTRTAPLTPRVVALLVLTGAVAALDASAEIAYVAIPKAERFLPAGCCTVPPVAGVGNVTTGSAGRTAWTVAFFGLGGAMTLAVALTLARGARDAMSAWWGVATTAGAAATLGSGGVFLASVLSPSRLRLPLHECAYCLIEQAPETVAGVAFLATATACLVWAGLAARASTVDDARPHGIEMSVSLLRVASLAYPASLAFAAVERWAV